MCRSVLDLSPRFESAARRPASSSQPFPQFQPFLQKNARAVNSGCASFFSFFVHSSGLLLQESNKFSEALHYYKLAIGSRPTLACKYSSSFFPSPLPPPPPLTFSHLLTVFGLLRFAAAPCPGNGQRQQAAVMRSESNRWQRPAGAQMHRTSGTAVQAGARSRLASTRRAAP